MLKKSFIILSFILSILYRSQTLDELDGMTEVYTEQTKYQEAIDLNIESLGKYKDEKNKKGIAVAYLNLADLLRNLNQPKQGLENLDEAKKYINSIKDNVLKGRLYFQYAKSYSHLDIEGEANINYNKAIQYFGKAGNSEKVKKYLYQAYIGKWADFEYTKAIDSAVVTQNKCLKLFPNDPMVYTLIAYRYVGMNSHFDTIKSNLDKAISLSPKGTQKGTTLLTLGDYYTLIDDFPKALDCYFQALEVFQKIGRKISIRDCYKNIRRTYLLLKDKEKADEYSRKFKEVNDEVVKIQKESSMYAVKKIVQEKEQEEQKKEINYTLLLDSSLCHLY
ncbi:tetratricopeptide repeat protein [Chryseobacterium sp. MMS23-Vi53]|uniref:tetratricopeptide repeat protein n=1 Tax=Chryseobacterium sp. MMS23-Vi53 TaxID=3386644 RepID=UPI0039E75515